MLSLGQSCSCSLRWDENRGGFGAGETPHFTAEAEMAQGLFPASDRYRRRVGDPAVASGLWRCRVLSEPRLSRGEQPGNCAGVGAAGIPAPARAQLHSGPPSQGHPGRAPALGIASRAISEALVTLPAGRNIPREPGINPQVMRRGDPRRL